MHLIIVCTLLFLLLKPGKSWFGVCPSTSQWQLTAKGFCNKTQPEYYCLLDDNKQLYVEYCRKYADFQRPGYKFVIRGSLDGRTCDDSYYQPFKFWTNVSSNCLILKSGCIEEGQIPIDNGSPTTDSTCSCDYSKGYAFITTPQNGCYCSPSKEDCSCFLKPCEKYQVLTPDFDCLSMSEWRGNFICAVKQTEPIKDDGCQGLIDSIAKPSLDKMLSYKIAEYNTRQQAALIVTLLTILNIILLVVCKWRGRKLIVFCRHLHNFEDAVHKNVSVYMEESNRLITSLRVNATIIIQTIEYKDIIEDLDFIHRPDIENCIGPKRKNTKLLEIVLSFGGVGCRAFLSSLEKNSKYNDLFEQIKRTCSEKLDLKFVGDFVGVDGLNNENIPKNIRDFFDQRIRQWISEDKNFLERKASTLVKEKLNESNCVIVVGPTGNGKSSIIKHTALHLCDNKDYDIVPIVIDPSTIFKFRNKSRNQVFVVDEFCGKVTVNHNAIDLWSQYIDDIIKFIDTVEDQPSDLSSVKLLIACDTQIYEKLPDTLKKSKLIDNNKLELPKMSKEEKEAMIKIFFKEPLKHEFPDETDFEFPLLCKIAEDENAADIMKLFSKPYEFISSRIQKKVNEHQLYGFLITLCALFNNRFEEDWFDEEYSRPEEVRKPLCEVCSEFHLDIKKKSTIMYIKETFQPDQMKYVTKSGNIFQFAHTRIYEIASVVCGKMFTSCFIKYASGSLIGNKYNIRWNEHDKEEDVHFIYLENKFSKLYFDRLLEDLEKGDTAVVFRNSQLRNETYRLKFCSYCKERKPKVKEILSKLDNGFNIDEIPSKDCAFNEYLSLKKSNNSVRVALPLIESVRECYEDIVLMLIDMECDINRTDSLGQSALFVASYSGDCKIVKLLLNHKANVALCDNIKRSPLFVACERGQTHTARLLIDQGPSVIDMCDIQGRSPLYIACAAGKDKIVNELLISGADINKCDSHNRSPLLIAAFRGHLKTVELLIAHGAEKEKCDDTGQSPLFAACIKGHASVIDLLIKQEESLVKIKDCHCRTPFFILCAEGHTDIVRKLILKFKQIGCYDDEERSPLYIACENGNDEIVDILLQYDANVHHSDRQGRSPLYAACKNGKINIVKKLIEKGAKLSQCTKWNVSPFHVSCREGNLEIAKYLLTKKDANINGCDSNGKSPLYVACEEGHLQVVNFLIQERADVTKPNNDKQSPLQIAQKRGHKEIATLIAKSLTNII